MDHCTLAVFNHSMNFAQSKGGSHMVQKLFTIGVAALLLVGCSSTRPGTVSEEPVKSSGSKPGWVKGDKTYWIDDNRMHFRVVVDNESDLSFAQRGLDGQAYSALINAVKVRSGMEYDEAVKGAKYATNSIGQVRQSVVNALGDVKFSDMIKSNEYWEQFQKDEGDKGVTYFYTLWGVYSISDKEFARAKEQAWTKVEDDVTRQQDTEARQILDEAKSRFLGKEK
jgi:hypothetical protein